MTGSALERRMAALEAVVRYRFQSRAGDDAAAASDDAATAGEGGTAASDDSGERAADARRGFTRRSVLTGIGLLGLGRLSTDSASADPQGQLGTATDPVRTVYAQRLAGGLTDGAPVASLLGPGLAREGEQLRARVADAANLGEGDGVFAGIEAGRLQFRTLSAGNNVRVTEREDELLLAADDSNTNNDGANLGTGDGLYAGRSGSTLEFRSLVGGTNVTLSTGGGEVTIDAASSAGETNAGANLGNGANWYAGKSDANLEFRSLVAGTNLRVTEGTSEVTLDATDTNTHPSVSDDGTTVVSDVGDVDFGTALSVSDDGSGNVTVDSTASDTRTNVSEKGTEVVQNVEDINFGTDFTVNDDNDGTVTVDATGTDTHVDVTDSGSAVTTDADAIDFAGGLTASDASGTATVDAAITTADILQDGATDGQVITWDGANGTWKTAFPGTTESTALDLLVANARAARFGTTGGDGSGNTAAGNVLLGQYAQVTDGALGATVGGGGSTTNGSENLVADHYGTIGGGFDNQAGSTDAGPTTAQYASVGGGDANMATAERATVGGGTNNVASAPKTTIGGGAYNVAQASFATIAGGGPTDTANPSTTNNAVYDAGGTVGGGRGNEAGSGDSTSNAFNATVAGGYDNAASGQDATVGGGTVNVASGQSSIIPGGAQNTASGNYAFAAGYRAKARNVGSFVWADSQDADFTSDNAPNSGVSGSDTFHVRAQNGARIVNGQGTTYIPKNSTGWSNTSTVEAKTNFGRVDPVDVLEGVRSLEITTWEYRDEDGEGAGVEHMGPVAEEFDDAFDLGDSDRHINSINADGVAFAAIQGVDERVDDLADDVADALDREDEVAALRSKLDAREERVESLEAELAEREARIESVEAELAEKEDRVDRLEDRLEAIERAIDPCE